jgi:hypothetical protein
MFCDDFEFKSVCFYDPRKLIHVLCVTGKNRSLFLHPTLRPVLHPTLSLVLHPTLRPAQKPWAIWRLAYRGQRWVNQRHGFFLCSWPPATELLTTRFGLLCWAIIGSPHF